MRAFLNQPVETHTGVIECMIRRKKGVMNTVYQAFYEVNVKPIVASGTTDTDRGRQPNVVRRKNARRADARA